MLISISDNKITNFAGFRKFQYEHLAIYYSGVFFIRGKRAGEESLKVLAAKFIESGVFPFSKLYGSYALVVEDTNSIYSFVDNSNMHGLLVSNSFLGSDLLELASVEDTVTFNKKAICEYLSFTRPYLIDTLFCGIKKLPSNQYAIINSGKLTFCEKEIGDITTGAAISNPVDFFQDVAYALEEKNCICALTGGYDSRLVTSFMHHYNPNVECFVSGDNDKSEEIMCAINAANKAGIKLKIIKPVYNKDDASEYVRELLETKQYKVSLDTSGYRILTFMKTLQQEGYEVIVTGNAGDMHKGFWDTRIIPLYPRGKSADMKKLVDKFFCNKKMANYLGVELIEDYNNLLKETYEVFESLIVKGDIHRSYLKAGWKDWVPFGLKYTVETVPALYSPLQELELVKYSYQICPKGKRMNSFHRKYCSYYNSVLSKEKTIQHTTCSDNVIYYFCDLFSSCSFHLRRLSLYLARKLGMSKKHIVSSVNLNSIEEKIYSTDIAYKSFEWGKSRKYIANVCEYDELPNEIKGKLLYLYYLSKYIKE